MRLSKIFINHFKGIDELSIKPEGKNVTVRGKNGTGKTTVADAYAWCMTGKGFDGKAIDTQIKKRDEKGDTPNDGGVEHTVEVEFEIDENHFITLKREFKEKWEKHRGQAESEFKGHTTTYSIDDVPMAKKEYERRVSDLVKGDTFQLLSMPLHFCTTTKWQDRRKILVQMCGNVTDADIIAADPELEPLNDLMKGGKSISDVRKVLQSKLKKTNDETKTIPARIDELTGMKPEKVEQPKKTIEVELESLKRQQGEKRAELASIESGGAATEKKKQLAVIESKMERIKGTLEREYQHALADRERVEAGCRAEIERLGTDIERAQKEADRLSACIETSDKLAADLRKEWGEKHDETYVDKVDNICPHCGQEIPEDKLEAAREKAREDFNLQKAENLKAINAKGKRIVQQKQADAKRLADVKAGIKQKQARINELAGKIQNAEEIPAPDYESNAEYAKLKAEGEAVKQEIEALNTGNDLAAREAVQREINALGLEIDARNEKLAAIKQAETIDARMEELKAREKELGEIYNKLQADLFLTEKFMRAKVSATEDSINSHFKYVRWKMFTQRINGALEECCEPLIDGVPFSDGLNKGNKMKAALDIVSALSKYYGVSLPVFIDDCESYTSLPEIDAQVIKLIADKDYDSLFVEIEE